jgi:hypothetical protein
LLVYLTYSNDLEMNWENFIFLVSLSLPWVVARGFTFSPCLRLLSSSCHAYFKAIPQLVVETPQASQESGAHELP